MILTPSVVLAELVVPTSRFPDVSSLARSVPLVPKAKGVLEVDSKTVEPEPA